MTAELKRIPVRKSARGFEVMMRWVKDAEVAEIESQLRGCAFAVQQGLPLPEADFEWLRFFCAGQPEEEANIVLEAMDLRAPYWRVLDVPLSDALDELHAIRCNFDDYSDYDEALGVLEISRDEALARLDRAEPPAPHPLFEESREDAKLTIYKRFNLAEKELENHKFWGDED